MRRAYTKTPRKVEKMINELLPSRLKVAQVGFKFEGSNILLASYYMCHASLNQISHIKQINEIEYDTKLEEVIDYIQWSKNVEMDMGDVYDRGVCPEELRVKYLDWLINESAFRHSYLCKDAKEILRVGAIHMNIDVNMNYMAQSCVANRLLGELRRFIVHWDYFVSNGINPDVALALVWSVVRNSKGRLVHQPKTSHHVYMHTVTPFHVAATMFLADHPNEFGLFRNTYREKEEYTAMHEGMKTLVHNAGLSKNITVNSTFLKCVSAFFHRHGSVEGMFDHVPIVQQLYNMEELEPTFDGMKEFEVCVFNAYKTMSHDAKQKEAA